MSDKNVKAFFDALLINSNLQKKLPPLHETITLSDYELTKKLTNIAISEKFEVTDVDCSAELKSRGKEYIWKICPKCNGEKYFWETCSKCNGIGEVTTHDDIITCDKCNGKRKTKTKACDKCSAYGWLWAWQD